VLSEYAICLRQPKPALEAGLSKMEMCPIRRGSSVFNVRVEVAGANQEAYRWAIRNYCSFNGVLVRKRLSGFQTATNDCSDTGTVDRGDRVCVKFCDAAISDQSTLNGFHGSSYLSVSADSPALSGYRFNKLSWLLPATERTLTSGAESGKESESPVD
jgi:hypothetical protein